MEIILQSNIAFGSILEEYEIYRSIFIVFVAEYQRKKYFWVIFMLLSFFVRLPFVQLVDQRIHLIIRKICS